jgi:hypothetical protein
MNLVCYTTNENEFQQFWIIILLIFSIVTKTNQHFIAFVNQLMRKKMFITQKIQITSQHNKAFKVYNKINMDTLLCNIK